MQLIAPDILAELRGLSLSVSGTALAIGLLLWLFGWRWHRFWVVVAITTTGGLIGLNTGRATGGHILALGLLLAVAAGVLALELARIVAFLAAGFATWAAASSLFPAARELWVVLLLGGLGGVLLYRLWMMLLTSLAGVLIAWHAGLCLMERLWMIDVVTWASRHAMVLNGVVIGLTMTGLVGQSLIEKMYAAHCKLREERAEARLKADERDKVLAGLLPPEPPTFWQRLTRRKKAA